MYLCKLVFVTMFLIGRLMLSVTGSVLGGLPKKPSKECYCGVKNNMFKVRLEYMLSFNMVARLWHGFCCYLFFKIGPQASRFNLMVLTLFMLNSAEHKIYPAHKC